MEENNTIVQLNEALSELLDAYDLLKSENEALENKLEEVIETKNHEIQELTKQKDRLEEKVDSLTSTTEHHSSELGTMLGRIKSTLGVSSSQKNTTSEPTLQVEDEPVIEDLKEEIVEEYSLLEENKVPETEKEKVKEEEKEPKKEGSKEIDLGRMQSLLNGFNS